jgi:phage tail sheath gpL-like
MLTVTCLTLAAYCGSRVSSVLKRDRLQSIIICQSADAKVVAQVVADASGLSRQDSPSSFHTFDGLTAQTHALLWYIQALGGQETQMHSIGIEATPTPSVIWAAVVSATSAITNE